MVEKILLRGVVHGNTVELQGTTRLPVGTEVEVILRPVSPSKRRPGEGFLRTEGALAEDTEWDEIMEEVYRSRKLARQ